MVYFTENKSEVASVKFLATARSLMILKLSIGMNIWANEDEAKVFLPQFTKYKC